MENRKTYKATPTHDAATSMKADNPFPMEYIEVSSVQSSSKQFKQGVRTIPGDDVHILFYRCSVRLKITCLGPKINGNVHS